jgi:beta-galactosidase
MPKNISEINNYKMKKILALALISFIATVVLGQSPNNKNGIIGNPKLYYGVAYYPEAYNLKTVDEDIRLMKEFNINVVRMAEFSWSLMEPNEGQYDFKWLHHIVDKLHANGIDVVLGTPTATPPIWMAEKYPDMFVVEETGWRKEHGARRNCNYTHPKYREYSEKITLEMAKEFGKKPGVIGWQTDNEFNFIYDYSDYSKLLWHKWLENKYKTIDYLNQVWCTNLWSQRYQRFDQIPMPKSNVWHHTSLRLDWDLFSNDQIVDYQKIQIDAIRNYSNLPITHDGMPGQKKNYPKLFEELDFMAVNCYHGFQAYSRVQTNYDRMRGYGKGMHWLFETAPNNSGGGPKGQTWFIHQPDGAMRAALWMNYAMGGQGAMFWLWRQQPAGQEMVHGAFISSWGEPSANAEDLISLGAELKKHSDLLIKSPVEQAKVALFYSHDNDIGLRIEESSNNIKYYMDWTEKFYTPVSDLYLHRDVIHENVDLDQYEILIAPLMPMVTKRLSNRLETWVKNGGTLIIGPMTGYRDEYWAAHTKNALGWLEDWMGIKVRSRIPIDENSASYDAVPMVTFQNQLRSISDDKCHFWSEVLSSPSGSILASYKNGMHNGRPAIIENKVGKGKVIFMGTYPGETAYKELIAKSANEKNIKPLATGGKKVLVVPRSDERGSRFLIAINLNNDKTLLNLEQGTYTELMSGKIYKKPQIELKPYEVMMLQKK